MRARPYRRWAPFALVLAFFAALAPAEARTKVVLQLQWDHQFQFAGYYAAEWQGYYRDAGLEVEIRGAVRPDGSVVDPVTELVEGRADFAVVNSSVLLRWAQGDPLVMVAAVFQQTGGRLIQLSATRIAPATEHPPLRVGVLEGSQGLDGEARLMLAAEGVEPRQVEWIPFAPGESLDGLLQGRYDLVYASALTLPKRAADRGVGIEVRHPGSSGIHPYGDGLVGRAELVRADADLVRRFRDASLHGWAYALEHPEEMIARISELPRRLTGGETLALNRFQSEVVRELTLYPMLPLGNSSPARWRAQYDQLRRTGMITGERDLRGFLFDPERDAAERAERARAWLLGGLLLASVLALAGGGVAVLLRRLAAARGDLNQRLEQTLRRVEAITENVPGFIWTTGPDGTCRWVNRYWSDYTGLPGEALAQRWADTVAEADRGRLVAAWRKAVRNGKSFAIELRIRGHDGSLRWFQHRAMPLRDAAGGVVEWVGVSTDIEGSKRLQASLKAFGEAQAAARAEAERADQAKSRFLAAASHDLRQPFQAMRLFFDVLAPLFTPGQWPVARRLDEAMRAGEELLTALLDLSTLDAGVVRVEPRSFAAGDLLAGIAEECRPQAEAAGLRFRLVPTSAMITSDPVLLARMLRNLVLNAIRYTPVGGVLLGARRCGRSLRIEVWDNGVGIAPAELGLIFEDFYQVANQARERRKGLGLGLSVVARMGRLLGHPVEVRSRPGRGSRFALTVPLALPAPPADIVAAAAASVVQVESIGGPGGTRTPSQAVMSGPL